MTKFSWQTHEYVHTHKSKDWYWTVGIITGAFVLTSLIFGNYLFAMVLAISAFSLTLFTMRPPKDIRVEIGDKGVRVDKTLYPYHALDSFGIDEAHFHGARLFLKSKKKVMPLIALPLADQDVEEVKVFLGNYLPEETFDQGFLHALLERLGF
ncbi:MAG TPA: hypothetical protein VGE35_02880 [Candidatus Paceibacterota bacterium]